MTPGLRYLIRAIKAGLSGNGFYYSDAVLREAAPMFNDVRVFVKSDEEHRQGKGKDFTKLIGLLRESRFAGGDSPDTGEIRATLELLESSSPVPEKIREAYDRGVAGELFGFSIDAKAVLARTVRGGVSVREVRKVTKVNSLDLIVEPSAGGEIVNLIEAINDDDGEADMNWLQRILEALKAANDGTLPDGVDVDNEETIIEALNALRPVETNAELVTEGTLTREEIATMVSAGTRIVEARADMRVAIAESTLPAAARKRMLNNFELREEFTAQDVREAIDAEREYIAGFGGGHVQGLGEHSLIEAGDDRADKIQQMMDDFFDPTKRGVISIKECYVEITGDRRVTGELRECDRIRLRESMPVALRESLDSTSWSNVLGDSMRRRIIADYAVTGRYDVWRGLVTVVPLADFRTNERTRVGGYGDLPTVAQGDPYTALTSPTDEKATYAPVKRGGTEDLTLETVKNDDVGAILRIPMKLTTAAKRTLSKFVLDFIATNPVIYDSVALFHATHNNLGSAALDATALAAGRLAILQQTELSSADRFGIPPINLWTPFDLEETGFDLFRRQTNNDTDFVESLQMNVIPVWYWTDANDWAITCDPNEVRTIEIGFVDGEEEPELFVQDNPTVGSLFTHDKITYKIRHTYGGNVLEFRGMYKAVVA